MSRAHTHVTVDARALERFVSAAFRATTVAPRGAALGAAVLVRTTLRGVESHGVSYLHQYVEQLLRGGANPEAEIRTLVDRGAMLVLDGDAGLGPAIAADATQRLIGRARDHGVAMGTVRNANHFGAAGHYGLLCAEQGCLGLVMSNTPPIMAATGSRSRSIGNSPLAFGAPRDDGPPMVLDIAMSKVAGGKIRMAIQNGEDVPPGWILDPDGNPTTDPEDFLVRRGALLPMGDHKGYGLSLMVEALAGALSGAAMLQGVGNWIYTPDAPSDTGYFLFAIDVSGDSVFPDFRARLKALCDEIVAAPKAPSVDRILVPGELEDELERRALADGAALRQEVWVKLETVAARLGLRGDLAAAQL